jgi:hypothetical protein
MRWPPGRGWPVVAMVIAGLSVLVVAGRVLAPGLGEPLVISTVPPPTGTIRIVPLTEQPSDPPPMTWSTVPAAHSGEPGRLTGGGVRLLLPGGWHGRTSSQGDLLVLQSANFLLATRDRSEGPIMAMTRGQVVMMLSTGTGCCPGTRVSASPPSVRRTLSTAAGCRGVRRLPRRPSASTAESSTSARCLVPDRRHRRCCGRPTNCWPR